MNGRNRSGCNRGILLYHHIDDFKWEGKVFTRKEEGNKYYNGNCILTLSIWSEVHSNGGYPETQGEDWGGIDGRQIAEGTGVKVTEWKVVMIMSMSAMLIIIIIICDLKETRIEFFLCFSWCYWLWRIVDKYVIEVFSLRNYYDFCNWLVLILVRLFVIWMKSFI